MKKTKKLVSFLLILGAFGFSYVSANDENRKNVESFINEEKKSAYSNWYKNNPTITKETFFYSENENNPSYIEYKISCKNKKDCGYIMFNLDNSDVKIPIASFTGKSISEQMDKNNTGKNKNYYFDIFNQFSISDSGKINSTSPENQQLNNGENIYTRSTDKNPLYEKFKDLQKEYSDTKNENIKIQEKNKYQERSINNNQGIKIINKNIGNGCESPTPCYNQAERNYNIGNKIEVGPTGCTPTAFSIVLGYYDRNLFSDIIKNNIAPEHNNFTKKDELWKNNIVKELQINLGKKMNTIIVESNGRKQGSTDTWNNPKGWTYIKPEYKYDRNYHNWYSLTDFIQKIKNEIDNGRPIIIGYTSKDKKSGHSIVGQGYRGNRIYTNFGWGAWSSNVSLDLTGRNFKGFEREGTFDRLDYIYNIRK